MKPTKYLLLFLLCFIYPFLGSTQNIKLSLTCEKESYYEGEAVCFILSFENTDSVNTYGLVLPFEQDSGIKILTLEVYDEAKNLNLLRFSEDANFRLPAGINSNKPVVLLKPKQRHQLKLFWNHTEEYNSNINAHHSFGVPLFAGEYLIKAKYQPTLAPHFKDLAIADSSLIIPYALTCSSEATRLKIKKTPDTTFVIEGQRYYTRFIENDRDYCRYYNTPLQFMNGAWVTEIHITNIPPHFSNLPVGEYFYSYFQGKFNEYIRRFPDRDIEEFRRFKNNCPDELTVYKYNPNKQLIYTAQLAHDSSLYEVEFDQPSGRKVYERTYAPGGKTVHETRFFYNAKGTLIKVKKQTYNPCLVEEL